MGKNKEQYNPFDTSLFLLDLASVDYGFEFYESLKDGSRTEGKNGMVTNIPEQKHKETE
ncbi:hypothetical protein FACS1894109_00760 [Spirochaetia bacterium]|nr:hypothetical protein FACS1894109_00760 [Spirochaetia bacterium]